MKKSGYFTAILYRFGYPGCPLGLLNPIVHAAMMKDICLSKKTNNISYDPGNIY
jgi:hypothetical protein